MQPRRKQYPKHLKIAIGEYTIQYGPRRSARKFNVGRTTAMRCGNFMNPKLDRKMSGAAEHPSGQFLKKSWIRKFVSAEKWAESFSEMDYVIREENFQGTMAKETDSIFHSKLGAKI